MAPPRKPRRICAHCHETPCRWAKSFYCSTECRDNARRERARRDWPVCRICSEPVKQRRLRFCSPKCAGQAVRAANVRPVCASCGLERTRSKRHPYCSRSCATLAKHQSPAFRAKVREGYRKAAARQREAFFQRVRAFIEASYRPVFDAHPEWDEATRLDVLRAAVPVWRRAYHNGWHARMNRDRRSA